MERAGFKINHQVAALGSVLGLLGFARDSYAMSLILKKSILGMEWKAQDLPESGAGTLLGYQEGWRVRARWAAGGDCRVCTDGSEGKEGMTSVQAASSLIVHQPENLCLGFEKVIGSAGVWPRLLEIWC